MKTMTRRQRGSATVELALLMIVIIPTLLYTFYLEDLLFYKFDLEETVVSTPWDGAIVNYRGGGDTGSIVTAAMQTFWDHTSAWNTYNDARFDGRETVHHQAMTAHQCWLAKGGQEVQCGFDKSVGISVEPTFNFMNQGGMLSCDAILGVQNYFLPEKFFSWWGKNDLADQSKMKMHTNDNAGIHAAARQDPYLYPKMYFGVVFDSWALNKTDDISPNDLPFNDFSKWVNIEYSFSGRRGKREDAKQFLQDAVDKEILGSALGMDLSGDMIDTPPIAFNNNGDRKFSKHHASGWNDSRHEQTYNSMQNKYFGVPENKW